LYTVECGRRCRCLYAILNSHNPDYPVTRFVVLKRQYVTVCNSLNKVLDNAKQCDILRTWLAQCWSVTRKSTMFTKEKLKDIIVTILCLAVFAGWGVLLALGV
jgi:hypothetical protein